MNDEVDPLFSSDDERAKQKNLRKQLDILRLE